MRKSTLKSKLGKILFRTVLFIAVFLGTALIVNAISNRGSKATYVELRGTSLPVVFTCVDDMLLSPMPAYRQDMDVALLKDAVVPLVGDDRMVTVYFEPVGEEPGLVTYQLRDITNSNLIEEGEMTRLADKDGKYGYSAELRMDMLKNREYSFVAMFNLPKEGVLRYYSRVIRLDREEIRDYLVAAEDFRQLIFLEKDEKKKEELQAYLEPYPPEDVNREDLGFVSLQSTYDTVNWGGLKPEIIGEVSCSLTELSAVSGTVVYRYQICTADEELTRVTYYDVEESISLEYVPELAKARVINYYRRVREGFRDDDFDRNINGVQIGLSDHTPEYLMSEDNEHMFFAQDDSVWYYDYNASTLTRIYGTEEHVFRFGEAQGVLLLSLNEEEGYYAVYGRLNSGIHEGENGVLLQHFTLKDRTIEDCAFISTNLPYTWLKQELGKLFYLKAEENRLYYLMAETVRGLDLTTGEEEIIVENVPDTELLASSDGSVIAFPQDPDVTTGHDKLILWDLASGNRSVLSKNGMKLEALNFVGEDFVYGVAAPNRVSIAADGATKYYFSSIIFVKRDGREEKDYRKSGILVSDVVFLSNTIYLSRVLGSSEGGPLTETAADYISYKAEDNRGKTVLRNSGGTDGYQIVYPSYIYMTSIPEILVARLDEASGVSLRVTGGIDTDVAYLYRGGELVYRSARIGTCVRDAADYLGTVVLADGSVLYRRRTGAAYLTVADQVDYVAAQAGEDGYAACLAMSLQMAGSEVNVDRVREVVNSYGENRNWEDAFRELSGGSVQGLNLSGATVKTALLFLGDGIPFVAKISDHYVLVVSFNDEAIRYYDPLRNYEVRLNREDFRSKVREAENELYAYVED